MTVDFESMLSTLKEVLKFESVLGLSEPDAPFGKNINDALIYTLNAAKKLGFKTVNMDGMCGYADIGSGEMFGILGHLDVVPAGSDWKYPPFGAEIHDETLYARGTLDDKGPMISAMYAVKALIDAGLTPKKRIRLIFGCDEETSWRCMDYYISHAEMPALGFSPDADFPVISCEKGLLSLVIRLKKPDGIISIKGGNRVNMVPDRAEVEVKYNEEIEKAALLSGLKAERGENLKISATGVSAHGSTPHEGENAFLKLFKFLAPVYPFMEEMYNRFLPFNGEGLNIGFSDDKSGKLTQNLGIIKTEGDTLVLSLDVRYPVTFDKKDVISNIKKTLNASVELIHEHPSLYVEKDHPLVVALMDAYRKVTKEDASPIIIGGATYARAMKLGVAYGPIFPGEKSSVHQSNECITLKNLEKMTKIYMEAIKKLCF